MPIRPRALHWIHGAVLAALLALTACARREPPPTISNPPQDGSLPDVVVCTPEPVDASTTAGAYGDAEVYRNSCLTCDAGACEPAALGCGAPEACDDGLDNDCDGRVDEDCVCIPGATQRCFQGPPGRRGLGVCADGTQTCQGDGEFGEWSECVDGIGPAMETCDGADNNCDGCADNGLCCLPNGRCPAGNDPRVPEGKPFQAYTLMGVEFYTGTARAWSWLVTGGPCDRLLYASKRVVSYAVMGSTPADPRRTPTQNLTFTPTLSGDYTITLRITAEDGSIFECVFIVRIRAPGFRAELCWDRTGEVDVDLWVHRPGNTDNWVSGSSTCYYGNCTNSSALNWGYAPTPGNACRQPAPDRSDGGSGTVCNNPRLDVDNVGTPGIPENINVDTPVAGDTFRVAVNYFGGTGAVRPMVNIYCGGALRATYGGALVGGILYGSKPVTDFLTSGGNSSGSLWRVVDATLNTAETCTLNTLVAPSDGGTRPCVETNTDRTYDGMTCVRR